MEIFKILGLIFISALLSVVLKQYKAEYSIIIAVICSVIVLTLIAQKIFSPLLTIQQKLDGYGIDEGYFKIALKALGIGYITSFIADSCRDAGQSALAFKAELAGKCGIFLLSVPLILNILETAIGFVK